VAHPDLIPVARAEFDAVLGERPNQLDRQRPEVEVGATDLIDVHIGRPITAAGVHGNVSVGIRYIEAWLRGLGAVAIDNLMEDAATAEISRSQVWQWIHQDRVTEDGTPITRDYVEGLIAQVLGEVDRRDGDRFDDAAAVFRDVALGNDFPAFLTLSAYSRHLAETE
jgi:malate synthase